jgi:hypothetical protein
MHGGTAAPQSSVLPAPPLAEALAPTSQQSELWGSSASEPAVSAPEPVSTVAPEFKAPEPSPRVKAPASAQSMPLEDAYKALRATPGATWESIEQTRRALVQQSHPSRWASLNAEKRAKAIEEAKQVNAAYAVLSQARCGRRRLYGQRLTADHRPAIKQDEPSSRFGRPVPQSR